jgi:hypothetical protein
MPQERDHRDYIDELSAVVDAAAPRLLAVSSEEAAQRPARGGWSVKEVIGHLVDSAANNHRRFVAAQIQDDLIFDGYEQDAWVRAQRHQSAPWNELVRLWHQYNRHLSRVMAAVPLDVRDRPRARHNLDQIAWKPLDKESPATLDYLMSDYVDHLRHHLSQIDRLLGGAAR